MAASKSRANRARAKTLSTSAIVSTAANSGPRTICSFSVSSRRIRAISAASSCQLHELIVRFDGFERLHENRLARRAGSVHYARYAPPVLGAHRDYKTLIPKCDVILSGFRIPRAQNLLESFLDRFARLRDAGADPPQRRRRLVADFAVRHHAPPNRRMRIAKISKRSRPRRQQWKLRRIFTKLLPQPSRRFQ